MFAIDAVENRSVVVQLLEPHDPFQAIAMVFLVSKDLLPPFELSPICRAAGAAWVPLHKMRAPNVAYTNRALHASHVAN